MAKTTPQFDAAYQRLNAAQREAVDTLEGPVMVVAGPGTGKTQILTLRIANILKSTDTPPDAILALTFTEAGVDAMKRRLLSLIGPTAYSVRIHTFHGFCNEVIHAHPEYFPRIISSTAITEIEAIKLLREAIESLPLDTLKPFGDPYYYVTAIKGAIGTLKREGKTPQDVLETSARLLEELDADPASRHEKGKYAGKVKGAVQTRMTQLAREHELGLVFERYELELAAKRKFDFEDMISEVVRALAEDESFRLMVQEQFLYILADEHQDANGAQNTLLDLLVSYDENPNLFIVGDEKQAIFRFQGASLESFDRFRERFPQARAISLTDSYRSGTRLLDAAHALMQASVPAERHPKLESRVSAPHLAELELRAFSTEELEMSWVVQDIERKIAEGVAPGEIAIMYRTNADAMPFARALAKRGILHTLDSKGSIFHDHCVAQLLTYLRLVTHIGSDEYAGYALQFPWTGITPGDAFKVMIEAGKRRQPFLETAGDATALTAARVRDPAAVLAFARTVESLAKSATEDAARDFFDRLLHESGYLSYVLTRSDAVSVLSAVRGLAKTLEERSEGATLYSGADFVRDLGLYEEYRIEIEPDTQPKERAAAVHLTTAHRSKGLEYEHVYIVRARDKKWGNRSDPNRLPLATLSGAGDASDLEDERRLFYVALTRGKQYVSVSYGLTSGARTREAGVTQFMLEIDPALMIERETESFEAAQEPHDAFARPTPPVHAISDHAYIADAFLEQGLSATALNNYLSCPWKYFYRNLVRLPEKSNASSLYGNAMHNALRLFRETANATGEMPALPALLEFLSVSIDTQGFSPASYEDAKRKGERALTDWYERHAHALPLRALCEKKFDVYLPIEGALERVLLRGLLDVIEFPEDGSLHVIDYKTGRHRTRDELEGKTKNADGDYVRQLTFYCILMEQGQMEAPRTLTLEFIEPDKAGKTVTHDFAYDGDAVAALKKEIARVANEIYTLAFWDTHCDDTECEYCALHEQVIAGSAPFEVPALALEN
ncbi:MAG TPA: ATP-dependent DNA helicase [Candidatus Paceibacterota bacterium]|nr:ATP-dependent DNA helicase [Candidatus Paceibacterota bacterium]